MQFHAWLVVAGLIAAFTNAHVTGRYALNFTTCSLCGLCIEACPVKPVKAIEFTKRYNLASTTNDYADMDLVQRYKDLQAKKS
jgi:NADH-quinone oxidoreductase subunit I